jgi:hypothetical protein
VLRLKVGGAVIDVASKTEDADLLLGPFRQR